MFHSQTDLEAFLLWVNSNRMMPKATLIDTFYDDHQPCYIVDFGGVFKYTFWWSGADFAFDLARAHTDSVNSKVVMNALADHLESWQDIASDVDGEGADCYQLERPADSDPEAPQPSFHVSEQLQQRIDHCITIVRNKEF